MRRAQPSFEGWIGWDIRVGPLVALEQGSGGTQICIFFFLWLHLRHVEVPRLEMESELQLPAYTTFTATWILNPLSEARVQTTSSQRLSRSLIVFFFFFFF